MELDVVILLVRHLIKDQKITKAIYRGGGSIAFIGACRVAYLVKELPPLPGGTVSLNGDQADMVIDANAGLYGFAMIGSNIGRHQKGAREYELAEAESGVVIPKWRGISSLSADDLLAAPKRKKGTERTRAEEFVTEFLGRKSRPAREVYRAGEEVGLSQEVLKRVDGVHRYQNFDKPKKPHYWHLVGSCRPKRCPKCRSTG